MSFIKKDAKDARGVKSENLINKNIITKK